MKQPTGKQKLTVLALALPERQISALAWNRPNWWLTRSWSPIQVRPTARSTSSVKLAGCRIIEREYINSGNFKNWSIPQATHEWVLIVDSDERVTTKLAQEINQLLAGEPSRDGYHIFRANYFLGHHIRHAGWARTKCCGCFAATWDATSAKAITLKSRWTPGRVGRLKGRLEHYTYWSYDQYFQKLHRYTVQGAKNKHAAGRRASFSHMLFAPPLRFFHCYVFRLGFLDGLAGLQISALTGMSSFVKQLRLWELDHALEQPDPEAEFAARNGGERTTSRREAA